MPKLEDEVGTISFISSSNLLPHIKKRNYMKDEEK